MKTPIFIAKLNEKPLFVGRVADVEALELVALQKQASENLNALLEEREALLARIERMEGRITALEREVAFLKGE